MDVELPGPLVSVAWLEERLASVAAGHIVLVYVRWYLDGRSGREAFEAGHLPGARWVDLDLELSEPAGPVVGRHPLASPERFGSAVRRLGIDDSTPVVVYDDQSGAVAARLWWMLDSVGHPVAVLDGGLAGWTGELESGPAVDPAEPGTFADRPWPPDRYADAATVAAAPATRDTVAAAAEGGAVVVDARVAPRFTGDDTSIDPRPGHVPGARNVPWPDLIDPASGRLRPPDELRARFARAGVEEGSAVIASCGSGVTACFDLLALRLAGVTDARLYPASWSGWSTDPDRPVALGD